MLASELKKIARTLQIPVSQTKQQLKKSIQEKLKAKVVASLPSTAPAQTPPVPQPPEQNCKQQPNFCGIAGGCIFTERKAGHNCPICCMPVHNICARALGNRELDFNCHRTNCAPPAVAISKSPLVGQPQSLPQPLPRVRATVVATAPGKEPAVSIPMPQNRSGSAEAPNTFVNSPSNTLPPSQAIPLVLATSNALPPTQDPPIVYDSPFVVKIKPDGNCQFRAISFGLFGTQDLHQGTHSLVC